MQLNVGQSGEGGGSERFVGQATKKAKAFEMCTCGQIRFDKIGDTHTKYNQPNLQFLQFLHILVLRGALQYVLGPKLFFVTGLVIFVTAVARLVCLDLLG